MSVGNLCAHSASKLLGIKLSEELLGDPHFESVLLASNWAGFTRKTEQAPRSKFREEQPVTAS